MRLLYVTPELIATKGFMLKLRKLHDRGLLNLIAIDEVSPCNVCTRVSRKASGIELGCGGFNFSRLFYVYFRHIASHHGATTSGL